MRKCTKCKVEKPLTEYWTDRTRFLGRMYECKTCKKTYIQKWCVENQEKRNKVSAKYRDKIKLETLNAYSNGEIKCACCSEKYVEFLAIDHVENDGKQDRIAQQGKSNGGGYSFYLKLKKSGYPNKKKYQVLCHNCNQAKQSYGKCPHKTESKYQNV